MKSKGKPSDDHKETVFITATTMIIIPNTEEIEFQGFVDLPFKGTIMISLKFGFGVILSSLSTSTENEYPVSTEFDNRYSFYLNIPPNLITKALMIINKTPLLSPS